MKARRAVSASKVSEPVSASVSAAESGPAQDAVAAADSASGQLPFLEQLEASFGGYDLSSIDFLGGAAAEQAAAAVGAESFATGETVADPTSDLFRVAHEVAHVLIQRSAGGGGQGVMEDAAHEAAADAAAQAVVAGESAVPHIEGLATPQSGPAESGTVERIKRHDDNAGTVTDVPIGSLSEAEVVRMIGDIELNGVGRPHNPNGDVSTIEYEAGDLAALVAVRDANGFGDISTASLEAFLGTPAAELQQAGLDRHIDATTFAGFATLFDTIKNSPRVKGFGVWAAGKITYVQGLSDADPAKRAEAAAHFMDYMNELREVEIQIAALTNATDTIDLGEAPIVGTGATADLTQTGGRQIEVKTVREPVLDVSPIRKQLKDGLGKFSHATTGGPYEVAVYATWQETPDVRTSARRGKEGATSVAADRSAGAGGFTNSFTPTPPNRRPASSSRTDLRAEILDTLNGTTAGAANAHVVNIRMENPDVGGGLDTYTFTRTGTTWA